MSIRGSIRKLITSTAIGATAATAGLTATPVHAAAAAPQVGVRITYAQGSTQQRAAVPGGQGGPLTFHAGQLPFDGGALPTPKLYLDFWGPQWTSDSSTMNFISTFGAAIGGSGWATPLSQYCALPTAPNCTALSGVQNLGFGGAWNDPTAIPSPLNDTPGSGSGPISGSGGAVQRAIQHFNSGSLDVNGVYMVLTPSGANPSWFPGSGACAYHSAIQYPAGAPSLAAYGVVPYVSSVQGCGANAVSSPLDAFTIALTHEYSEAITDPDAITGWIDDTTKSSNGGEIADKCEIPTNSANPGLKLGGVNYAVAANWSNKDQGCVFSAASATAPATPTGVTATPGVGQAVVSWTPSSGATSYKVTVSPTVPGSPFTVTAPPATVTGLTNGTPYSFSVVASNSIGDSQPATANATPVAPQTFQGGGYTSVVPYRVLDTRPGTGHVGSSATPGAGATITVPIAGTGGAGGVPANATGVVLNVTAVTPTAPGFLTVFPAGVTRPNASNLNFNPGDVVPNLVEVALGTGGAVSIFNSNGSTDVLADVAGYTSSAGDGFNPVTPARLEDTRGDGKTLAAGGTLTVALPSSATGATGAVFNVTVTNPTAGGFLTVYPTGSARPNASNLNFGPGQTVPNRVQVKVGTGSSVTIFNLAGSADVIVDLNGYFAPGGGATFTGVTPTRLEDTRNDHMTIAGGGTLGLTVAGPTSPAGVPAGAKAVVLNVTVANPTQGGFVTVSPGLSGHANASDLNFGGGQVVPNLVVVGVTNSGINLFNFAGSTDVIVDIAGWYS